VAAWKPSTRNLETIAELGGAGMPPGSIARALDVPEADFRAYWLLGSRRRVRLMPMRYLTAPLEPIRLANAR